MKANRTKRSQRNEDTTRASTRAPNPRPGPSPEHAARGAHDALRSGRAAPRAGTGNGGDADGDGDTVLDHRKAAILNAVVSEYIETAQPVGSAHITGNPGVEVSSATVRSEMAALERDGYLAQPHTSAGRIPTDKGYR